MSYPNDFLEVDFLAVESAKSGDAIAIRSAVGRQQIITVVDGGFTDMGEKILSHIRDNYGAPAVIDHVVLTHPDGDHAKGLKHVLENATVSNLWMNRPWLYTTELLPRFETYNDAGRLTSKLKSIYSNVRDLEEIANERGVPIREAFQGQAIGYFTILGPSRARYLDLVVDSARTPAAATQASVWDTISETATSVFKAAANFVRAAWGEETFSNSETSSENDMSLVQYAEFGGMSFLLTGDAGRGTLAEAADYAPWIGLALPGIDRFQVPHHGSRRNLSSELLDRWLGERLDTAPATGTEHFHAFISSAAADPDHPRKSVERAIHHRGGRVYATEGQSLVTGWNRPTRPGWTSVAGRPYPEEQEE